MGSEQYRVVISFDEENKQFVATVPELPLFTAITGATRAEVLEKIDAALEEAVKLTIEQKGSLPKAVDSDETLTGEVTATIGKTLHRELAFKAKKEGLDLSAAFVAAVSAYVYGRRFNNNNARSEEKRDDNVDGNNRNYESRRSFGIPREGSDAYRTLMDDSATFREFLRQQERSARPQRGNRNRRPQRNNNGGENSSNNEQ